MKKFVFIFVWNGQKLRTHINSVSFVLAKHTLLNKIHPSAVLEGFEFFASVQEDFELPYIELSGVN